MELVYNERRSPPLHARTRSKSRPDRPVLVDRFLEDAIEVDVDCIADGEIDRDRRDHGAHRAGRASTAATAPASFRHSRFRKTCSTKFRSATKAMARELKVRGLMNVQFAVKGDDVYVLEVNPRASRTVPFVSKAIGVPLAKLAAKVMTGKTLRELGFTKEIVPKHFSVKEAVFPFLRYQGARYFARAGNEIDRRSDGHRCRSRARLCEIANGRAAAVAQERKRLRQRERHRQGKRSFRWRANLSRLVSASFPPAERRRHWPRAGIPVTRVFKIREGRPQRARPGQERRHQFHHQHAQRKNSARR